MDLSEAQIQKQVIAELQARGVKDIFFWHCQGVQKMQRGAAGARIGMPDLMIIKPKTYPIQSGIFAYELSVGQVYGLELKAKFGSISQAQTKTLQELQNAGAIVAVTYGLEAAIKRLEDWGLLRGKN